MSRHTLFDITFDWKEEHTTAEENKKHIYIERETNNYLKAICFYYMQANAQRPFYYGWIKPKWMISLFNKGTKKNLVWKIYIKESFLKAISNDAHLAHGR